MIQRWFNARSRRAQRLLIALALSAGAMLVAGVGLHAWVYLTPYPESALAPPETLTTQVVDRRGAPLRDVLHGSGARQIWMPLEAVSPWIIAATLAGEDHRFGEHDGVDGWAILRASGENIRHGRVYSGASTLTMQLVRLLEPELSRKDFMDKFTQAAQALRLEERLSKYEIIEQYLNRAPYGRGAIGVEAASLRHLGKHARDLSLAEAALLSVMPRGPEFYDPYRRLDVVVARQRHILTLMREREDISESDYRRALSQPIELVEQRAPFEAPHFVDQILAREKKMGQRPARLETTLDLRLQRRVEAAARHHLDALAVTQAPKAAAETQAAVVVVDNHSGEILAMVGSRDWRAPRDGQVNGAAARRQAGSTLKPFLYALSLSGDDPLTAASALADVPTPFHGGEGETYLPRNFDGRFRGPVRLRTALAGSLNVPAVRAAARVGVPALLSSLRAAGLQSLDADPSQHGLGLSLGSGAVSLLELVEAYATLARGGVWRPLRWVRARHQHDGARWASDEGDGARVIFSPQVAFLITDILSDPLARASVFGLRTPFRFGYPVALKTGTSTDARDSWTIGYTPQITVGVWIGRFDGAPMGDLTGAAGAGPLFRMVMEAAMRRETPRPFAQPDGVVRAEVCALSGRAPSDACPHRIEEIFIAGTEPRHTCDWHREVTIDRRDGLLATPGCDPAHVETRAVLALPDEYLDWAMTRRISTPPTERSPWCATVATSAAASAQLEVVSPPGGARFLLDPSVPVAYQTLELAAQLGGGVDPASVRWQLNGHAVDITQARHHGGRVEGRWILERGRHSLRAVAGGVVSEPVVFEVQ